MNAKDEFLKITTYGQYKKSISTIHEHLDQSDPDVIDHWWEIFKDIDVNTCILELENGFEGIVQNDTTLPQIDDSNHTLDEMSEILKNHKRYIVRGTMRYGNNNKNNNKPFLIIEEPFCVFS